MRLRLFKVWLISIFNPKYQLTLSETIHAHEPNKTTYIFKQYGSYDFVHLTFLDIKNNSNLLRVINPKNLLHIHLNELSIKKIYETYHIIEEIRNNKFKIKNMQKESIYSGEYICKNIDMFQNINPNDLCKIGYATGFNQGRKMSLTIKTISNINDIQAPVDYKPGGNIVTIR